MGELQEKLNQMGLDKNNPPGKETKLKTELEQAIEADDKELVQDALRLRLEEKNLERKINIKTRKEELRGGTKVRKDEKTKRWSIVDGKPIEDPEGEYESFAQATKIAAQSKRWAIVDGKPIEDPEGEYETFAQAYKVAALAAAKAADPTAFFKFLKAEGIIGGKATGSDFTQDLATRYLDSIDAQLKAGGKSTDAEIIKELRQEMSSLREEVRQSSDPIVIISKAKALTDGLRGAGLIPEPSVGAGAGLDELKERHRHEEKMEEIKAEVEYKQTVGKTFADIPKSIGRGIASQIAGEGEESGGGSSLTHFICTEEGCGTKIPVLPEATSIKCPKCGMVYERTK